MLSIDLNKVAEQFLYNEKAPLIFNSGFFLFLFTAFITFYYLLHRTHRAKLTFVMMFSLYFYYKSSGIYFLILVASTVIDYTLAHFIYKSENQKIRKALLVFSLFINLGLLGYFKYTNFLYEIFCNLSNHPFDPLHIFLPVGVSFFTFQSLSYTLDIYRGHMKPVKNILDYAFFVSFFPQLVAGPIVRAYDFAPQIYKATVVTAEMLGRGVFFICIGLFKKAVVSDYISLNFVDRIFDTPQQYSGLLNLAGVYGYALQIYCDFSGYSDMATGIALLMGFEFCKNFDSPYQSSSITEFWRRWHISLSSWLRDYLYISLGGNRKGKLRTYLNQFITMLLGGLWHGANIRFILWGAMHGVALGIDKFIKSKFKIPDHFLIRALGIFITFNFVCFCWIFFRSENMHIASTVIYQISHDFRLDQFPQFFAGYRNVLILMGIGYILHFIPGRFEASLRELFVRTPLPVKAIAVVLMAVLVIQVKSSEILPFIYFKF